MVLQHGASHYIYGHEVKYILESDNIESYRMVAEKINECSDIGIVCVQHEFGLFSGEYGDYLLSFFLALNKPIVTVFHTVLPEPDERRKKVVQAIADLSDKVVVLTKKSQEILINHYGYQESKIKIIPHGTHTIPWEQKDNLKKNFRFQDRFVMSTFGLISENKSIETVLYALPEIVRQYPEITYLILGKTHPEIIKREGEKYRDMLSDLVKKLHLESNVIFVNEFLELKQLLEYLTLSDLYLFSSKDPHQAVSGTFAYAMSSGCAIISTPIPHAKEALANGGGVLLDGFGNPQEFQSAILEIIKDKEKRMEISKNAFSISQASRWENVVIKFGILFSELTNKGEDLKFKLIPIKIDHIVSMTTEFGILQFSNFSKPDPNQAIRSMIMRGP